MEKKQVTKDAVVAKVKHFSNFKGTPMVTISGNFFGGGFNLSKNKVKAVLDNVELLTEFVEGKFDEDIKTLGQDEILEV